MRSNFAIDGALGKGLVSESKVCGTHGYSPDNPDLLASFFLAGPGVKAGLDLGQIDMRSIAPTLARYLGARLEASELPALDLGAKQLHK